jgi:hypothetical protein
MAFGRLDLLRSASSADPAEEAVELIDRDRQRLPDANSPFMISHAKDYAIYLV